MRKNCFSLNAGVEWNNRHGIARVERTNTHRQGMRTAGDAEAIQWRAGDAQVTVKEVLLIRRQDNPLEEAAIRGENGEKTRREGKGGNINHLHFFYSVHADSVKPRSGNHTSSENSSSGCTTESC